MLFRNSVAMSFLRAFFLTSFLRHHKHDLVEDVEFDSDG